ncbi:hypothetical protein PK98_15585 [Croceibacterium mercuriale]|uniref:Uncharacterized protein n=1 Tax=Croceibacterium mercuriale TaxID=1572751 RepID=A0A0B2BRU3_9SPHN|nr:hypothetical protein [Croceibacterium mercuriale]KHL24106.1 hypothetical protein PK98_15585 [Croceibacterium mercuriale]
MQLHFQEIRPGDVEQELTQKDQFDTDKVPLTATLVREALQNVMDARAPSFDQALRVRIAFHNSTADREFWEELFTGFRHHLDASGVSIEGVRLDAPRFLLIEDFGTTGLRGATEERDEREFSDFWRRVGKSHKSSGKGGSWGLGKLVFPVSSTLRCFFGLTIRSDDSSRQPKLMGQTILSTHVLDGRRYVPHGFFCNLGQDGIQVPAVDDTTVERFRRASGFARTDQPGLSIAIPFPRQEITIETLIPFVIEHYFFPILTGELIIQIGDETISAETLEQLAERYPAAVLKDGHMIAFIKALDAARTADAPVNVPDGWDSSAGLEAVLDAALVQELRARYLRGELLHFRLPIACNSMAEGRLTGSFDVFLQPAPAGASPVPLFIRNSITVPNEASYFTNPHVFAAVVASDKVVSSFLRDAENPAHTSWNGRAEKLMARWRTPGSTLPKIRHSARKLDQLVGNSENIIDPDALISLLHIPKPATAKKRKVPNPISPPSPTPPEPTPRPYRIIPNVGGFTVKGAGESAASEMPMSINVRMAYAIARGDAFKRYDRNDFSLTGPTDIGIQAEGATSQPAADNVLLIEADAPDFSVTVSGFDPNRDVIVQSNRVRA